MIKVKKKIIIRERERVGTKEIPRLMKRGNDWVAKRWQKESGAWRREKDCEIMNEERGEG